MPYPTHTAVLVLGAAARVLRGAYSRAFPHDDLLEEWSKKLAPAARTKARSIASGERVASGAREPKEEAYKDVDIFTKYLWYHDKNRHVLYDNAHQFANVLKQMLNAIKNRTKKDKLNFNNNIRATELRRGMTILYIVWHTSHGMLIP
jgi:hypothetical protein